MKVPPIKRDNTEFHKHPPFSSNRNYDSFVAFDFETTGLDADAQITEIGAVKVEYGEVVQVYSQLVNPGMLIPPAVQRLTGISDSMVAQMPHIDAVIGEFLDFVGDLPLVAHNARFDLRFLRRDAAVVGREITSPVVDTLTLARKTWYKLPSYKLTFLADYFCIAQPESHRARCDAQVAAKLYLMMRDTAVAVR